MDLHYLKIFNVLASELSFSKAAETLYISQPAVSIQIKKFESELGFKLFDKMGKILYLTEKGKVLNEYTQKIFSLVNSAEKYIQSQTQEIHGQINIGASNTPGTYILPKAIGRFKESYPLVDINLHIANTFEIEHMILDNKADFAVSGGNFEDNENLHTERLMNDEVILVASPSNKLTELDFITPEHLIGTSFIAHEKSSHLYKLFDTILTDLGLPSNILFTLGYIDAIKQAVMANLGITAIPRSSILIELRYGLLKELKIPDKHWFYPYSLIYHKNKYLTPAVKKLIEDISEQMKD